MLGVVGSIDVGDAGAGDAVWRESMSQPGLTFERVVCLSARRVVSPKPKKRLSDAVSSTSATRRGPRGAEEPPRAASRMRAGGVAPESRPPSRLLQALPLLAPFACPWSLGALHAQRTLVTMQPSRTRLSVLGSGLPAGDAGLAPGNGGSASYLPPPAFEITGPAGHRPRREA